MLMLMQEIFDPSRQEAQRRLLIWLSLLMGVVIVGGLFLLLLRRKLHQHEHTGTADADTGFSLASLREMRDRGELTPEEYESTRARVIAKVKAAADKPAPEKDPRKAPGGH
jgi:hypothetical protein